MTISTLATLTFLSAAFMLAQSGKEQASTGEALFQQQCVGCHGPDGHAQTELGKKLGAADLSSDAIQQQADSQLAKTVKDGKGKMPAFDRKLKEDEIHTVITYIRHLATKQ